MYDVIVVGTDGSEKANEAVERALGLAEANDAELHAITVVNTSRYGEPVLSSTEMVLTELEDRGTEQLAEISAMAADRGLEVVTKCFHGNPSEEVLEYAEANDADLIVLGSHGHTHPTATIGSTADRVLNGTSRQVLIV
jgi:nucleotide-binding universal stress UspA family protein